MKDIGYGAGYQYAHDYEYAKTEMKCLPKELQNRKYYKPTARGFEGKVKDASS
jgi:putative ATPase